MEFSRLNKARLKGKALPPIRNTAEDALGFPWVTGTVDSAAGVVPLVATRLTSRDRIGSWKVRWGIGRMQYTVPPGLYGVGRPDQNAPVLVTANYKMTFDVCDANWVGSMPGFSSSIPGINVWCAAGKGTFGTGEIVRRIRASVWIGSSGTGR